MATEILIRIPVESLSVGIVIGSKNGSFSRPEQETFLKRLKMQSGGKYSRPAVNFKMFSKKWR